MPFLIELWNSQHGMVWDRLTGTGLGWMRRPTFKCSQYTAPTFPIQLQYGTFGTGVATAQKFAQVWLQAGYDQKKCGNCCTSFPKIHCGSRWFWVLLENKKLQGSVVMSVSTTTQEYNCFDKHLNTSLLRKLWQPWLLGKPHWNSCCAPNHPGKGLDPPSNQANAHLILANSSLKKCPKPSGQGFRPTHPYGQCPNRGDAKFKGASLTLDTFSCLLTFLEEVQKLQFLFILRVLSVLGILSRSNLQSAGFPLLDSFSKSDKTGQKVWKWGRGEGRVLPAVVDHVSGCTIVFTWSGTSIKLAAEKLTRSHTCVGADKDEIKLWEDGKTLPPILSTVWWLLLLSPLLHKLFIPDDLHLVNPHGLLVKEVHSKHFVVIFLEVPFLRELQHLFQLIWCCQFFKSFRCESCFLTDANLTEDTVQFHKILIVHAFLLQFSSELKQGQYLSWNM